MNNATRECKILHVQEFFYYVPSFFLVKDTSWNCEIYLLNQCIIFGRRLNIMGEFSSLLANDVLFS